MTNTKRINETGIKAMRARVEALAAHFEGENTAAELQG